MVPPATRIVELLQRTRLYRQGDRFAVRAGSGRRPRDADVRRTLRAVRGRLQDDASVGPTGEDAATGGLHPLRQPLDAELCLAAESALARQSNVEDAAGPWRQQRLVGIRVHDEGRPRVRHTQEVAEGWPAALMHVAELDDVATVGWRIPLQERVGVLIEAVIARIALLMVVVLGKPLAPGAEDAQQRVEVRAVPLRDHLEGELLPLLRVDRVAIDV